MRTVICASSGRAVAGSLSSVTAKLALPLVVGRRQVGELLAHRGHLVVGQAEGIAGDSRRAPSAASMRTAPARSRSEAGAP